jgi:ethanolamine utilization protein EutN
MKLGIVIGQVVASRKTGAMDGRKILVVRYLNEDMTETGTTHACVDTVNAGPDDIVMLCASSSARLTATTKGVATDSTIVGIVDSVAAGPRSLYDKSSSGGR